MIGSVRIFFLAVACVVLNGCGLGGGREVVYTPAGWPEEVKGTIFKPEGDGNIDGKRPAVLLLHGGIKLGVDGRWVMNGTARRLAERGYYVMNVTYRGLNKWGYPSQLDDVRAALAWMRENRDREGIDVNRIAVFGYSAGGYLGALAAMDERKGKSGVKVVVAGAAPSDLTVYAYGDLMRRYFGKKGRPEMEQMIEASSLRYVRRGVPPVFMYHGTRDELVRPTHTMKMADALGLNGVPHEVFWMEGKGHVEGFFASGEAVEKAIDFMDRYLKP